MRIAIAAILTFLSTTLVVCAVIARRSAKSNGKSVSELLVALVPPVLGNLIIIISANQTLSTVGYYIYFLGMNIVMYSVLSFALDYCHMKKYQKQIMVPVTVGLVIDSVQMLCNIFFGHTFSTEQIESGGFFYYKLIPYFGQTFHRVIDYSIFIFVLGIFIVKLIRSPKISSERYYVILLCMIFTGLWQTFYIFSGTPVDRSMIGYGVFGLLVFYFSLYYRPLRLLDRMLAAIASEMPEALFFFDNTQKCIWANSPGEKLLGISAGDYELVLEKLEKRFGQTEHEGGEWTEKHVSGTGENVKSYVLNKHTVNDNKGRMIGSFLTVRDNTDEQKELQREIYNATHDSLTNLYNRAGYDLILSGMNPDKTLMLLIDVDHFKQINDTYGHETGDRILKKIAGSIENNFRSVDHACRIGGDEFIVLINDSAGQQTELIKARINAINKELSVTDDGLPAVSVSAGGVCGRQISDKSKLFEHADKALYETKRNGRKGFTMYANE